MNPGGRPGPVGDVRASGGFEIAVIAIGSVVFGVAGIVFGGARLATALFGGHVGGGLTDILRVAGRLAKRPGSPAAAWGTNGSDVPGPIAYWSATVVVVAVVVATVLGGLKVPAATIG